MKIQFYKSFNWKDYWETQEDYYFETKRWVIKVPSGFLSDFGSIPRIFWIITHPIKYPFVRAFLLHDYCYSCKSNLSRKDSDDIFFWEMLEYSKSKALLFYLAVRIFWNIYFRKPLPFDKEKTPN